MSEFKRWVEMDHVVALGIRRLRDCSESDGVITVKQRAWVCDCKECLTRPT